MTVFPALVLGGIVGGVMGAATWLAIWLNRGNPDSDYTEHPEWAMWYEGNDSW